jgi:hypothetical protein
MGAARSTSWRARKRWPAGQRASGRPVARGEHPQQGVQPVADPAGLDHQLVAGVDQQLEVGVQGGRGELGQPGFLTGHPGDGDRVGLVVLAAGTAAPATLSGQRRGDVDDPLAGGQQHAGEGQPIAAGAFHRHQPRPGERAGPAGQACQLARTGTDLDRVQDPPVLVDRRGDVRAAVGIDPDDDHPASSRRRMVGGGAALDSPAVRHGHAAIRSQRRSSPPAAEGPAPTRSEQALDRKIPGHPPLMTHPASATAGSGSSIQSRRKIPTTSFGLHQPAHAVDRARQAGPAGDGRSRGAARLRRRGGARRLGAVLALAHATHALCGAHLLRELDAIADEPGQGWAAGMAELLVDVKLVADRACAAGCGRVDDHARVRLQGRYQRLLSDGQAANPPPAGSSPRSALASANLLARLDRHREEVLRSLDDTRVPFDNN